MSQSSSVGLAHRRVAGRGRAPARRPTSSTLASPSSRASHGQELVRHRRVHQQRLGRVAHAGALHLRVDGDPRRHLEVGIGVHVDVAVRRPPRTSRAPSRPPSAPPSAPRRRAESPGRRARRPSPAPRARSRSPESSSTAPSGSPASASASRDERRERAVRALGIARAAQHDRVPGLQAERCAVDRHVRARLVDHRDHAQRHAHLAHLDAAAKRPRSISSPTGSASAATTSTPSAIASTRSRVSVSRSRSASVSPAARSSARSAAFASSTSVDALAQEPCEPRERRVLRARVDARASASDAARAPSSASVTVRVVVAIGSAKGTDGRARARLAQDEEVAVNGLLRRVRHQLPHRRRLHALDPRRARLPSS